MNAILVSCEQPRVKYYQDHSEICSYKNNIILQLLRSYSSKFVNHYFLLNLTKKKTNKPDKVPVVLLTECCKSSKVQKSLLKWKTTLIQYILSVIDILFQSVQRILFYFFFMNGIQCIYQILLCEVAYDMNHFHLSNNGSLCTRHLFK